MLKQHCTRQLEARLKAGPAWEESNFVFCNGHGGFLEPSQLHMMFRSLLEDAGLPQIRFHDVRRFGDCKIALKGQKVRAITF